MQRSDLMKKFNSCSLLLLLTFLITTGCGEQRKSSKDSSEPTRGRVLDYTEQVTFLTADGEEISTIRVAVADDQQERNQGLMDVNDLPSDAGMLFIFPTEAERSFYMANTPLPLDIMFVNSDSVIVRIHQSTSPFTDTQLRSGEPAQYVVETNGGYAISNDIQEGMRIRF